MSTHTGAATAQNASACVSALRNGSFGVAIPLTAIWRKVRELGPARDYGSDRQHELSAYVALGEGAERFSLPRSSSYVRSIAGVSWPLSSMSASAWRSSLFQFVTKK